MAFFSHIKAALGSLNPMNLLRDKTEIVSWSCWTPNSFLTIVHDHMDWSIFGYLHIFFVIKLNFTLNTLFKTWFESSQATPASFYLSITFASLILFRFVYVLFCLSWKAELSFVFLFAYLSHLLVIILSKIMHFQQKYSSWNSM